jgi:hypothetical protein
VGLDHPPPPGAWLCARCVTVPTSPGTIGARCGRRPAPTPLQVPQDNVGVNPRGVELDEHVLCPSAGARTPHASHPLNTRLNLIGAHQRDQGHVEPDTPRQAVDDPRKLCGNHRLRRRA